MSWFFCQNCQEFRRIASSKTATVAELKALPSGAWTPLNCPKCGNLDDFVTEERLAGGWRVPHPSAGPCQASESPTRSSGA